MHEDANVNGVGAGVQNTQVFAGNNSELLSVQLALVSKLVQTLSSFDNVMFEICNEPYVDVADTWQAKVNGIHDQVASMPV